MAGKYMLECKFHRSDNLPESMISQEFRSNVCNDPSAEEYQRSMNSVRYYPGSRLFPFDSRLGEKNCQLYRAWEENARLKRQIAEGGLEEKAKTGEDERLLGRRELN